MGKSRPIFVYFGLLNQIIPFFNNLKVSIQGIELMTSFIMSLLRQLLDQGFHPFR